MFIGIVPVVLFHKYAAVILDDKPNQRNVPSIPSLQKC